MFRVKSGNCYEKLRFLALVMVIVLSLMISINVAANMMESITLYDMYDVTEFDVKTTFVYNTIPITYSYEYGTGWAQQWTNFGYSSSLW